MIRQPAEQDGEGGRRGRSLLAVLLCAALLLVVAERGLSMPPCNDDDGDGVCKQDDCDDGNPFCAADCSDGDSDGYCDDQDNCPGVPNPGQGSTILLDGPPEKLVETESGGYLISSDGATAVYLAAPVPGGAANLYSIPVGGGTPVQLNDLLTAGGAILAGDFVISPDGAWVVYRADQDADDVFELYSVPMAGGTVTRLNGTLVADGDVGQAFAVTPDSATVLYVADQELDTAEDLFQVPITGGTATRLSGPLLAGRRVRNFQVSPDGSRVLYQADAIQKTIFNLYSVPLGGGATVQLNTQLAPYASVQVPFAISPDSSTVVYRAEQDVLDVMEIYSVPIAGGTPVQLNDALVAGGNVEEGFAISPDGATVLFRADRDIDEQFELYAVPIGGGITTELNDPPVAGGAVLEFVLSPDGGTVVYRSDQDQDERIELYSVPITGGTVAKLNGPLVVGGDVRSGGLAVSPDSSTVVYVADQDEDLVNELYSVPISGGTVVKLNGPLVPGGAVALASVRISADSALVVYVADQDIYDLQELYSVSLGGGPVVKVGVPVTYGGGILPDRVQLAPVGVRAIYLADVSGEDQYGLYSIALGPSGGGLDRDGDGHGLACDCDDDNPFCAGDCTDADGDGFCPPMDCDDTTPQCTDDCNLDADGDGSLCFEDCDDGNAGCSSDCTDTDGDRTCAPQDCDDGNPYCAADCTDGDGDTYCDDQDNCPADFNPGQSISIPLDDKSAGNFLITADSRTVVYLSNQDQVSGYELYSQPIGGGAAIQLADPVVWGNVKVSDDSRVAVIHDTFFGTLRSVPLDGGPVVPLDYPQAAPDVMTGQFRISPDGSYVVFLDYFGDRLYSAPLTGGSATQISGTPVSGGGIEPGEFTISPDGSMVVYRGDHDEDDVFELYSVPIGGGTVTKLNDPLPPQGDVLGGQFAVSPDSARVVYVADQEIDNQRELYSVPIGGGAVVKLNGPLVALGDVELDGFQVTPDSAAVVYRARQDSAVLEELYSVPIGGGARIKLNAPLVQGGDVKDFAISADSASVLYLADQDINNVFELYGVPLGGGVVAKLNGPLVAGGNVQEFQPAGPGLAVYLADQDSDEVFELYSVPAAGGTPTKLNGVLPPGGDVGSAFLVSADGAQVVYRADEDVDNKFELYVAPAGGGVALRINVALPPNGDVNSSGFRISGDATTVVYRASTGLYSVGLNGMPGGLDGDGDGLGGACDCDDSTALCTTDCTDADGDGYCVTSDCDDTTDQCTSDCGADADGDGFLCQADCDETNPYCAGDCTDADGDGYCPPLDCDDATPLCNSDCTNQDGDAYCAPQDCDDLNPYCTSNCTDGDGDGHCVTTDCEDGQPWTYDGAPERNDTADNQCPDDYGYGVTDEVSGPTVMAADGTYSWDAQAQATEYDVLRMSSLALELTGMAQPVPGNPGTPGFAEVTAGDCLVQITADTWWNDPETPGQPGEILFYTVRPAAFHLGSWGVSTPGERMVICTGITESVCDDGHDNDADQAIDCADSDCAAESYCPETLCNDTLDNDLDTLVDCLDPDCHGLDGCQYGTESRCGDGFDNDADGNADCLDWDCNGKNGCTYGSEQACNDGIDNDGDGDIDCADSECATNLACLCLPAPAGLVGWWPGDGTGDDLAGSNPGVLWDNTGYLPGKVQDAFSTDGSGDYVRVAHSAELDLPQFTVATWLYLDPNASAGTTGFVFSMGTGVSTTGGFVVQYDDRRLTGPHPLYSEQELLESSTNAVSIQVFAGTDLIAAAYVTDAFPAAGFHHIAATFDGSVAQIYVDGVAGSAVGSIGGILFNGYALRFGSEIQGLVDEMSYFDRVLGVSEIQAIIDADQYGMCKGN